MMELTFQTKINIFSINVNENHGYCLVKTLIKLQDFKEKRTLSSLKSDFEENNEEFELFWYSKGIEPLKENGSAVL
ncbi:MAG: hypothetical protein MK105_02060 [Crocinitomicaceae bacterium]|nr:hypothetical protein [Crocinitomicaceae bacterium]